LGAKPTKAPSNSLCDER